MDISLREAFDDAVAHIGTRRRSASLSDATQRRLFGLYHRALRLNTENLVSEVSLQSAHRVYLAPASLLFLMPTLPSAPAYCAANRGH